jgi:TRAP-type uncharacterized transport system fused permease subunit
MIFLFVASIVGVALILYFGKRLKPKVRVALAVLAFLLVNLPTIVFLVVGDKPLPGARTVTQEELREAAKQ